MLFKAKDRTKELIDGIWCEDYYLVAARETAPTKNDLLVFSNEIGIKLPKEYIAHSSGFFGGLYLEVKEDVWPRAKAGDVGPFWSFLYGLYTFAYTDDAPDWMNIKLAASEFQDIGHNVLPILKVIGDADIYCLNQEGNIVRWSHEEDTFEPFSGSFFDMLGYELKELDARLQKKKSSLKGQKPISSY